MNREDHDRWLQQASVPWEGQRPKSMLRSAKEKLTVNILRYFSFLNILFTSFTMETVVDSPL